MSGRGSKPYRGRGGQKNSNSGSQIPSTSSSSTVHHKRPAAAVAAVEIESDESDIDVNVNVNVTQPLTPGPGPGGQGQLKKWKDFAVTGKLDNIPLMVINIEGYGPLTFPIYSQKIVEDLRRFMVKSDYSVDGGKRRILNPNVRLSSEIPAARFKFTNPDWTKYVTDIILPKIGVELGFDHLTTRAVLRKLLIYEKGSFFAAHSDVVQAKGHFGTLIVQLPSRYSGGVFKCSYGQIEKVFDHSSCKEIDVKLYMDERVDVLTIAVNPSDSINVLQKEIENRSGLPRNSQRIRSLGRRFNDDETIGDLDLELPSRGNELCGFYTAFYMTVEHEVGEVSSGVRSCLVYNLIDPGNSIHAGSSNSNNQKLPGRRPSLSVYKEQVGD